MNEYEKIDELLSILATDDVKTFTLRQIAAEELRKLKPEITSLLINSLNSVDVTSRRRALIGLGYLRDRRAVEPLILALRDQDIRVDAEWALRQIKDENAVDQLSKALAINDPETRRALVWALVEIESPKIGATLLALINDHDSDVRATAIYGLGKIKNKDAAKSISSKLTDPDIHVRRRTIVALSEIQDISTLDEILRCAKYYSGELYLIYVDALYRFGVDAIPLLTQALIQNDTGANHAAIEVLGHLRAKSATVPIASYLTAADYSIRDKAIFALGRIGDTRYVSDILALMNYSEHIPTIATALGNLQTQAATEALLTLLKTPDNERVALESLAKHIDPKVIEPILNHLACQVDMDAEEMFRASVLQMHDTAVVPLMKALNIQNTYIQSLATELLGELRATDAIVALQKLFISHTDEIVKRGTAQALAKIGTEEAIEALKQLAVDSDEQSELIARLVLAEIFGSHPT